MSVEETDRDVLRFLWMDGVTSDSPEIKVYRFSRVVFGVSSSPTIRYHEVPVLP